MVKFDIIGALKTYADANNMKFLSGSAWFQNYESDVESYDNGELVLGCDFNCQPTYSRGQVQSIRYSGVLMLGRKFEELGGSGSNVDETFYQKYVLRLQELTTELDILIREIICANELEVLSCTIANDLNKFDTNIDFVAATITFEQ